MGGLRNRYVAALALNIALALLVLFIKGFDRRIYYVDALGIAGAVSILLGLLSWTAAAGAFDTIGYGFSALFSGRKYKDLFEYTLRKNEKRSLRPGACVQFLAVGAVFLLISFLIPLGKS